MLTVKRILNALDKKFEAYIIAALLVGISVVMMVGVIARYVFSNALSWGEEFCCYSYIWVAMLSVGYCVRNNRNLRVEALVNVFPRRIREILSLSADGITAWFYWYIAVNSVTIVRYVHESGRRSAAMGIAMYLIYAATMVGFGIGSLRCIQSIVGKIKAFYFSPKE